MTAAKDWSMTPEQVLWDLPYVALSYMLQTQTIDDEESMMRDDYRMRQQEREARKTPNVRSR